MSEMSGKGLYNVAEATQILKKALGKKDIPGKEAVTILAKDSKLQGISGDKEITFSKENLARYIAKVRMERYGGKRLSEESRYEYLSRKVLTWSEAIYVFHGIEPPDQATEIAGFQFPNAYSKLWGAIEKAKAGSKVRDDAPNTVDTIENWRLWFGDPDHVEQGWVDTTDTTTFENSLGEISAIGSPTPRSARKKAEYNEMARALYRAMAENPGESAAKCAGLAAGALKPLRIRAKPTSITRRTGKIDQSLLASLQAKLQAEEAETSPKN